MACNKRNDGDNRRDEINNNKDKDEDHDDDIDSTTYTIINIEVDGLTHKREKGIRYQMLRDKYLKSRGVLVERMRSEDLWRMNSGQLELWIHQTVAKTNNEHLPYP